MVLYRDITLLSPHMSKVGSLAIILAAGRGSRLKNITSSDTKCMLDVDGQKLINLYLASLFDNGCSKVILVTGHGSSSLVAHVNSLGYKDVHFVHNPDYSTTNNIYSLKLAFDYLKKNDISYSRLALFESDIWINRKVLDHFLTQSGDNSALVSPYEYWMDGTCVEVDADQNIKSFVPKTFVSSSLKSGIALFKTVNIYQFSCEYVEGYLSKLINAYIEITNLNEYYEDVIRLLISLPSAPSLNAWRVSPESWHEIDDEYDLLRAETTALLSRGENKMLINQYGGFWKYSWVNDINLLVNPHFPPEEMIFEISTLTNKLIRNYPSCQKAICMIASKTLSVSSDYIAVGNGASELISKYFSLFPDDWQIIKPAFLEYERVIGLSNLEYLNSLDEINFKKNLIVINPNNPTGDFVTTQEIIQLAEKLALNSKTLFYDESFSAFSDTPLSLLSDKHLKANPNLVVLKSIGKSYGVPGLRLGLIASSNTILLKSLRESLPIWNISAFAEAFLDLLPRFKHSYENSLYYIKRAREHLYSSLVDLEIQGLIIHPSQANFLFVEFVDPLFLSRIANLLNSKNLLFKYILPRDGLSYPSLRLAITDLSTANLIIECFSSIV